MCRTVVHFTKNTIFALSMAFTVPNSAAAHGESEPGPHGGEIRMPGAFHIEAVAVDDVLRVYLLDMQFENPQVADSSVTVSLRQNDKTQQLQCRSEDGSQRFVCRLPDGLELTTGELLLDASRGGVPGRTARYELPLMQGDDAGSSE